MKESSATEKYKLNCELEHAVCGALLLGFNKEIQFDYSIPDPHDIKNRLEEKLPKLKIRKSLKDKINQVISTMDKDDNSSLVYYMVICGDYRLRDEWFYGYGTLYTWRSAKEKSNAKKEMIKHLNEKELEDLKKVWELLKIQDVSKNNSSWWKN